MRASRRLSSIPKPNYAEQEDNEDVPVVLEKKTSSSVKRRNSSAATQSLGSDVDEVVANDDEPKSRKSSKIEEKWKTSSGERSVSRSGSVLFNPTITTVPFEPIVEDEHNYVKIVGWNINGLRAILAKSSFERYVKEENPTVLALLETKTNPSKKDGVPDLSPVLGPEYAHLHWSHADQAGYSGTFVASKVAPLRVVTKLHDAEDGGANEESRSHNNEGRLIALEFSRIWVVATYWPNSGEGLKSLPYRRQWNEAFEKFLQSLQKPYVVIGDLNVAHHPVDLFNPAGNKRSAGFTDEERADFTRLLEKTELVDVWRQQNPISDLTKTQGVEGKYTYWGYRNNLREQNKGWRVDYALAHKTIPVHKAFIRQELLGSDHTSVGVLIPKTFFFD